MIQYALKCSDGHRFESWFQSSGAFENLRAAGHLACSVCGSGDVEKAIMSPRVKAGESDEPSPGPLGKPATEVEASLTQLRRHIEANTEDVGKTFASEARAIHDGTAPARAIRGEARLEEARKLIEDGVAVTPLPFIPTRRTN
ncbi:DUF1178 family protein [Poseidonocella pacifica]|nr:DUF1178 family protein [Poseidonocella pacifica]